MRKTIELVLVVLALAVSSTAANATTISYTLNLDHCGGSGCGGGPFGTVTLNDFGTTDNVLVSVTLLPGVEFVDTGFAGAFGFNLNPNPATISVINITSGFDLAFATPGALGFNGLGQFEYA